MMHAPTIHSVGLPPEKHADRVVAEMLRMIASDQPPLIAQLKHILKTTPDGNPAAQEKLRKKLADVNNKLVPDVYLEPGKRGRYTMHIVSIAAWDAEQRDYITDVKDRIPDKPWLACIIVRYQSKGQHRYRETMARALLVTHHSLSRLAQRYGAQTAGDLLIAADAMMQAFLREIKIHGNSPKWIKNEFRLHFKLEDATGFIQHITAIIKLCDDGDSGATVVTLF